jgi:uncharacterized protein (TIGR02217 family)
MTFHDKRLPVEISYGSLGGPGFKTSVAEAGTGKEQRNIEWSRARARYDLKYGIRNTNDMVDVIKFFYARRGRAYSWRFKDHLDYQIVSQSIAVIQTTFALDTTIQLFKRYDDGEGTPYDRVITKPVDGSLTNLRVNGVIINPSLYTVDYNTGEIYFDTTTIVKDSIISVDYIEFDVPVRFDIDDLPISMDAFDQNSISSIPVVEVTGE